MKYNIELLKADILDELEKIERMEKEFTLLWADYREGSKKAEVHVGFDINHSIPSWIFLADGKEGERPYASQITDNGQTGVLDRSYQYHENFDCW